MNKETTKECKECGGTGNSVLLTDGTTHVSPKGYICTHCKGSGEEPQFESQCEECDGTGKQEQLVEKWAKAWEQERTPTMKMTDNEFEKELKDIENMPKEEMYFSTIERYQFLIDYIDQLGKCRFWEFKKKKRLKIIFNSAMSNLILKNHYE